MVSFQNEPSLQFEAFKSKGHVEGSFILAKSFHKMIQEEAVYLGNRALSLVAEEFSRSVPSGLGPQNVSSCLFVFY